MNTDQIQNQLEEYYRRTFPQHQDASVFDMVSINEGWESIIYVFKLIPNPKTERRSQNLILRIYPGTDAAHKSGREYEGLQTLYQVGYPVPQVIHLERDHSPFDGRPFLLMEHVDGEMMWPVLDRAHPEQAAVLITQFCELFVQLHRLDWCDFIPKAEQDNYRDPFFCVDGFMKMLRREVEYFPELNAFLPIMNWLDERRQQVPCRRPATVHWDFHPGNVILKPDNTAVVIDWTQIQVSDPRFDLAWTLMLAMAYTSDEVREMILAEYQRIVGETVEQLEFFDVASCVKRLGTVMISLSAGADSLGMRPDAVALMRRDFPALQRVYNLMVRQTGIRVAAVERLFDS